MRTLTFDDMLTGGRISPVALALVLTAHGLAVWMMLAQRQPLPALEEHPIIVSLVPPEPPAQSPVVPPQVIPPAPRPVKKTVEPAPRPMPRTEIATPAERLVAPAAAAQPAPAVEAAAPVTPEPPQEAAPPQPVKAESGATSDAIERPRFNADYLNNPAPGYPPASRRMREEGTVVLRVRVDAEGHAAEVTLRDSSGHPRLDERALDTVKRWKFVPARQGGQPVEAWVIVPIQFSLKG